MRASLISRQVVTILVIASTFNLGESQLFSTILGASKRILKTTKVKTTVTNNKIVIQKASYQSVAAEAGTSAKQSPPPATGIIANFVLNLKGTYNSCGCGGDRCVNHGKCRISGYNPICCNNRCYCVQATVQQIADKFTATCLLCHVDSLILKFTCREASVVEFNCWTKYQELDNQPPKNAIEYAYF